MNTTLESILVEEANLEDSSALAKLECDTWGKPEFREYATWTWSGMVRHGLVLKATHEGEIIGVASLDATLSGRGFISVLIVAPEFRGIGVAKKLLGELIERADDIQLFTLIAPNNKASQRAFSHHGFEPYKNIGKAYCSAQTYDEWRKPA